MKKYRTWKEKLTKKQKKHLSEMKINYKHELLKQKEYMKSELDKPYNERMYNCSECRDILNRLGWWEN